jgi:hypothetical protein
VRTLEQRWEDSLRQQRQVREEYDRFVASTPATLSDAEADRTSDDCFAAPQSEFNRCRHA